MTLYFPDLETYRSETLVRTARAVRAMEARGLTVLVTGSLSRGDFNRGSDVDFLVTVCPTEWRYRIEAVVEDELGFIPFDVVYLDELTPGRAALIQRDARPFGEINP